MGRWRLFAKAMGRASKLRFVEATRGREEREEGCGDEKGTYEREEKRKKAIPREGKGLLLKNNGGS